MPVPDNGLARDRYDAASARQQIGPKPARTGHLRQFPKGRVGLTRRQGSPISRYPLSRVKYGKEALEGTIMDYRNIITIEPGKRGGKPCIRGMRITLYDSLAYFASGMTKERFVRNFPYPPRGDIRAGLSLAATASAI